MSGNAIITIICTVIGFFLGGWYGSAFDTGFHPYCWVGMFCGFIIGIGGCACVLDVFE